MIIRPNSTAAAVRALVVSFILLAASVATFASAPAPRWEQTFRPAPGTAASQPLAARELADGTLLVVTLDSTGIEWTSGLTAIRYDHTGTALSSVPMYPPYGADRVVIDPFGDVFVVASAPLPLPALFATHFWMMKYEGSSGRALWKDATEFLDPGSLLSNSAASVLLDAGGNPVVTIQGSGTTLVKYDGGTGLSLWPAQSLLGTASDTTALDPSGNIFVTTQVSGALLVFKYSGETGVPLLEPVSVPDPSGRLLPVASAISADGLVVTAVSRGSPSVLVLAAFQVSGDGNLLWGPIAYDEAAGSDRFSAAIATDAAGDVLLSGSTGGNLVVLKLSGSLGHLLWGPKKTPALVDFGNPACVVAGNGDLIEVAFVSNGTTFEMDSWRFSGSTGGVIWGPEALSSVHRDNHPAPTVYALSSTGGLLLCAEDQVQGGLTLMERDGKTGSPKWGPKLPPAATQSSASLVDLATSGSRVAVIGNVKPSVPDQPSVATLLYDRATGALQWGPKILGPAGTRYSATQAAIDGAGNVVVTGNKEFPSPSGAFAVRYSGVDGALMGGPVVVPGLSAFRTALDSAGNAFILGTSGGRVAVAKIGSAGTLLWGPIAISAGGAPGGGDDPVGLAVDASGNVVAVGVDEHLGAGLPRDWTLSKLAGTTGATVWGPIVQAEMDTDVGANALVIDSVGDVVVTGSDGSAVTMKYSGTTGSVLWGPSVLPREHSDGLALAVASGGDVFISGFEGENVIAFRLDGSDGTLVWGPTPFDGPGHAGSLPYSLGSALDADGNFVVAGTTGRVTGGHGPLLIGFDANTGGLLWDPVIPSGSDDEATVGFSLRGRSILIGTSRSSSFRTLAFDEGFGIQTTTRDVPISFCGEPVAVPLDATGGTTPYTWTLVSGVLPDGVSLSSAGVLAGSPVGAGVFLFRVRATDANGETSDRDLEWVVQNGREPIHIFVAPQGSCATALSVDGVWAAYEWLPTEETTPSIIVQPLEPTTYAVLVSDASGCRTRGTVTLPSRALVDHCEGPQFDDVSPASGPAGGGVEVTITGQNFQAGAAVRIGDASAAIVTLTPSEIVATVPSLVPGGAYDVLVVNSDGLSAGKPKAWFADFLDVPPSNLYAQAIQRIVRNGVSSGCGSGNFCPDAPVSRSQIAVFLLRADLGPLDTPAAATGTMFADVPADAFAAKWIEDFSRRGITTGCAAAPAKYCPDDLLTRSQLAPLLLRTKLGKDYVPPSATGAIFADVPADAFAARWIEDFYNRKLTGGCADNPLRYCPDSVLTRGEMAAFLTRAFSLP